MDTRQPGDGAGRRRPGRPWGRDADPRALAVRAGIMQRALLLAEARVRAGGAADPAVPNLAALLDGLAADEEAAWHALGAALAGAGSAV